MSVPDRIAKPTPKESYHLANLGRKQSRIPWAKSLPSHWKTTRIKYLARPEYRAFTDGDWIETPYITLDGVRLIQCGNVGTGQYIDQGFKFVSPESMRALNCTEVKPYDILICRMRSSPRIRAGRACLAPDLGCPMITAVDNCILKPRVNVDPRFIVYQLSSPNFLDYIEGIARGGTRDRISRRMLGDFFVALPPFDEQQAIAVFLDCETAKIDELIAKNERLDDLLREKRSVLIRRVVTGGVDDAAHTVDSGVPWLGRVPSHWVIKQLKHALMFQRGHDLPSSDRVEGTVPVVTSAGPSAWHDRAIAKAPGIVTGRYGTIGVYYFIEQDYWPLNTTLYSISLHGNVPRFLWYMLHALTDIFLLNSAKSAVPGVDRNDLHRVVVAVPPVNEQAEIVDYLDTEVRAVEALMAKVSEAVESLRAYRAAIITAAVTGQINVSTYCSEASCP